VTRDAVSRPAPHPTRNREQGEWRARDTTSAPHTSDGQHGPRLGHETQSPQPPAHIWQHGTLTINARWPPKSHTMSKRTVAHALVQRCSVATVALGAANTDVWNHHSHSWRRAALSALETHPAPESATDTPVPRCLEMSMFAMRIRPCNRTYIHTQLGPFEIKPRLQATCGGRATR
jgi:hypothetical protein